MLFFFAFFFQSILSEQITRKKLTLILNRFIIKWLFKCFLKSNENEQFVPSQTLALKNTFKWLELVLRNGIQLNPLATSLYNRQQKESIYGLFNQKWLRNKANELNTFFPYPPVDIKMSTWREFLRSIKISKKKKAKRNRFKLES